MLKLTKVLDAYLDGILEKTTIRNREQSIKGSISAKEGEIKVLSARLQSFVSDEEHEQDTLSALTITQKIRYTFIDRKALLNKYLKEIRIQYDDEENWYFIQVTPNLEGMPPIVYAAPYSKKYAYQYDWACKCDDDLVGYESGEIFMEYEPDVIISKPHPFLEQNN